MSYESAFEIFEAAGRDGAARKFSFKKAGTLAAGDRPELYFFDEYGAELIVCISGEALDHWQRAHRYLSREEKIDVAGMFLKTQIEGTERLAADKLVVGASELGKILDLLGIHA